ncbi:MAG: hypothetical protein HY270_09340 [Deltaproteobacteria bacterium]|nr:hypothetical protein [Deltaproteobacteria bacterium]
MAKKSIVALLAATALAASVAAASTNTSTWHAAVVSSTCGDGIIDPGEQCDLGTTQNGTTTTCCTSTCQFRSSGEVCRDSGGLCDLAETCTGSSADCPADLFQPATTACGNHDDTECTHPDTCDGFGACVANHEAAHTPCYGPATNAPAPVPVELGNNCLHACDGSGSCLSEVIPNCCGNGIVEAGEQCDDGNQYSGIRNPAPDGTPELGCPSDALFHCNYAAAGLLVRGNRLNPANDKKGCQLEFALKNPANQSDRFGLPSYLQTCLDGDPTCDFDATPGRCGFKVSICLNVTDPNLSACSANGLSEVGVLRLRGGFAGMTVYDMQSATNTAAMTAAATHLFDPNNPGVGFDNQAPLTSAQTNLCSAPTTITVFASDTLSSGRRARFILRTKTKDRSAPNPKVKRSTLRLTCQARSLP